jgi:hypothetical protein
MGQGASTVRKEAAERTGLGGLYYGIQLTDGGGIFPDGGVRVLIGADGHIVAASFVVQDESSQRSTNRRHRWRYTVPAVGIARLIDDLGPIEEEGGQT